FFQAEDGIRDYKVTGVQTCALPILEAGDLRQIGFSPDAHRAAGLKIAAAEQRAILLFFEFGGELMPILGIENGPVGRDWQRGLRSEERRVGKEGRCGWAVDD